MSNLPVLGSQVTSKKTGFPGIGTVVGVTLASWYRAMMAPQGVNFALWDTLYPNWHEKLMVTVYFDAPRKPLTKQEYFIVKPDGNEFEYEEIPELQIVGYPVDDLEIFE